MMEGKRIPAIAIILLILAVTVFFLRGLFV